jgi:hypothetical protein
LNALIYVDCINTSTIDPVNMYDRFAGLHPMKDRRPCQAATGAHDGVSAGGARSCQRFTLLKMATQRNRRRRQDGDRVVPGSDVQAALG